MYIEIEIARIKGLKLRTKNETRDEIHEFYVEES